MAQNRKKLSSGKKRFSMELSGVEFLGWAGLLLLVCLWFFVLGVLVGRGLVPVTGLGPPLEEELARAKEESLQKQESQAQSDVRINFHKALKEEGVAPPAAPKSAPPKPPGPAPAESAKPEAPAAVSPASQPSTAKTPAPSTSEDSSQKAIPADAGKPFTIQVAAVKDARSAEEVIAKLKKNGFDAYSVEVRLDDGAVWHRIRSGAFESREAAAPLLSKLKKAGYGPVLVPR